MSKRDFVFRHDPEIQYLFEQQQGLEREQDSSKRAMSERFLKYAAQASAEELQAAKLKRTPFAVPSGPTPGLAKIPVEEAVANAAIARFSQVFQLQRVQTRFLFRVSQYAYLTHLLESLKDTPSFDVTALKEEVLVDPWEHRMIFETSDEPRKEALLAYSRRYLEEVDPALWNRIRSACDKQIRSWSRAYSLMEYTANHGPSYGQSNVLFHAKAFAGALLALSDFFGFDLSGVIHDLERAIKSGEAL